MGGFGLHCAWAGAKSVEAVDSSVEAVREGKKNSELNRVTLQWHEANVFDWLRQAVAGKRRYDLIILDPPSFTRTRGRIAEAMKGYKEIHVRALQLLEAGGYLATYCCSHHVSLEGFEAMIREAAGDVRRSVLIKERHFQGSDHPVLLGMPETEYLKGVVLETI
ncbi:MAG: class I SAM-dependent methyltransferase [Verrucomicrobiia bacterium]